MDKNDINSAYGGFRVEKRNKKKLVYCLVLAVLAGCQGTEEDIPNMEDTDELEDFYYFTVKDAKTQEIELKLITCIINGNEGHVWLDYSLVRYGENGKIVNSSNDILLLCYIEKQWGEWKVVQTKEAP